MNARVMIIGGGAAGLCAACALAKRGFEPLVLEGQARVGKKLLATGNGRCNLTNMGAEETRYHGDTKAISVVFQRYPPQKVRAFFRSLGLETVEETEGRVYPMSRQAASVLDALRLTIPAYGGTIQTEAPVATLRRNERGRFEAQDESGAIYTARRVLVATGGLAAPKLGGNGSGVRLFQALGHTSSASFSTIVPLKTDSTLVRALKGQRVHCTIAMEANQRTLREENGEVLFGDGSLSGIAAMQLARNAQEVLRKGGQPVAILRLVNGSTKEWIDELKRRKDRCPFYPMEDFLSGICPKRVGMEIVKAAKIALAKRADALTQDEIARLAEHLCAWRFPITGVQGFEHAQATSGGVRLNEFDWNTMQSKYVNGLFAAGEVLNVDGDCGGYNLQWAWASALTAADGIAQSLQKER